MWRHDFTKTVSGVSLYHSLIPMANILSYDCRWIPIVRWAQGHTGEPSPTPTRRRNSSRRNLITSHKKKGKKKRRNLIGESERAWRVRGSCRRRAGSTRRRSPRSWIASSVGWPPPATTIPGRRSGGTPAWARRTGRSSGACAAPSPTSTVRAGAPGCRRRGGPRAASGSAWWGEGSCGRRATRRRRWRGRGRGSTRGSPRRTAAWGNRRRPRSPPPPGRRRRWRRMSCARRFVLLAALLVEQSSSISGISRTLLYFRVYQIVWGGVSLMSLCFFLNIWYELSDQI